MKQYVYESDLLCENIHEAPGPHYQSECVKATIPLLDEDINYESEIIKYGIMYQPPMTPDPEPEPEPEPIPIYGEQTVSYSNFTTKTLKDAYPRMLETCLLYGETWKSGSTLLTIKNATLTIQNHDKTQSRVVKNNASSNFYLRGIDTYQDELDFVNLTVKRYIKTITADDTAKWVQRTDISNGQYCYYINLESTKIAKQGTIIANHPTLTVEDTCWDGRYLVVWSTTIKSLSAFKEIVKANPITAHYVLATPTTSTFTSDDTAILFEGTNYITVSATNKTPKIKTLKYVKKVIVGYE